MSTADLKFRFFAEAESHFKNEEFAKANEKYQSLMPYLDEMNMGHAEILGNFSISLRKQHEYSKAEEIGFKRLKWYRKQGEAEGSNSVAIALIFLCELYWEQELYQKSLDVMLLCDIAESEAWCLSSNFIAKCYIKLEQPILAKKYAQQAVDTARNEQQKESIRFVFKNLL